MNPGEYSFIPEIEPGFLEPGPGKTTKDIGEADAVLRGTVKKSYEAFLLHSYSFGEMMSAFGTAMEGYLQAKPSDGTLERMHEFMQTCIEYVSNGREHYESFKVGFLGQHAVAESFRNCGCVVKPPTPYEDSYKAVDLWVDLGDRFEGFGMKRYLAVQVKVVSMENLPGEILFPVGNEMQVNTLPDVSSFDPKENRLYGLMEGVRKMRNYIQSRRFDNVQPVVVLIPQKVGGTWYFDRESGRPSEEMAGLMAKELADKISFTFRSEKEEKDE